MKNTFFENKQKRKILIVTAAVLLVLTTLFCGCAIYLGDYYRADIAAVESFASERDVAVFETENMTVFEPEGATKGFIFYPGGKVEHTSYIPLMKACADEGIMCVLVKMPFNLAVLDMNAALDVPEKYPHIKEWYIGGHSLGGAMAASCVSKNTDAFNGLVLLGAYSTADLSESGLSVLSVYGSEDGVMNREKYEEGRTNLPEDLTELVLEGGCHAYFGMYGAQDGDGTPTVTAEEQIRIAAREIVEMIKK